MIVIGADIVPTISNENYFINGNKEYLLGEDLCDYLENAQYRIFNLEVPLYDGNSPIIKYGPNLKANSKAINLFKRIDVNLVTLANNHIMDHGRKGFQSTLEILKSNNIEYVGCGNNLTEAVKPVIIQNGESKVGIYACVEHEFSIAGKDSMGANPFDLMESYDHVSDLKQKSDYVIVLYHGGKEFYRYPSPDVQKYARKFIEKGADLVICQHSHCVGCKEEYKNGIIVYGQGNFLFDRGNDEFWNSGLLISIDEAFKINFQPIVKKSETVRMANKDEAETILKEFYQRSGEIQDENVKKLYATFSKESIYGYLWVLSGANKSIILRGINRLTGQRFYKYYVLYKYGKEQLITIQNFVECEAHRELFIDGLRQISKEN